MKQFLFAIALITLATSASAQKYFTRSGYLGFFSKTKMEDIKADNNKVTFILDAATGQVEISALQQSFEFEKALMQEHYNENYVESEKYPKATFKGKVDMSKVNFKKDGTYNTTVTGDLTMHGVTKSTTANATFTIAGGKITTESKFPVSCKDFNIEIPAAVKDNISDRIDVTAKAVLDALNK